MKRTKEIHMYNRGEVKPRRDTGKSGSELLELLIPFVGCFPPFGYTAADRCMERGLLPGHLLSCLHVLEFLSVTVLSAQKAQRALGVRASVLLSMALDESAFDVRGIARDPELLQEDYFNKRLISPRVDQWFMKRAKMLAGKRFKRALACTNAKTYLQRLSDLGYCDAFKSSDLISNIESYELESCDLAGMLPIGEYYSGEYKSVKDQAGNVIGLRPSEYQAFLRQVRDRTAAA